MTVIRKCTHTDVGRPKMMFLKCPNCGADVEIYTDEEKAECESCGSVVFKNS